MKDVYSGITKAYPGELPPAKKQRRFGNYQCSTCASKTPAAKTYNVSEASEHMRASGVGAGQGVPGPPSSSSSSFADDGDVATYLMETEADECLAVMEDLMSEGSSNIYAAEVIHQILIAW